MPDRTAPPGSDHTASRGRALALTQRALPYLTAAVIGTFLAQVSVFATFLLFNFILHWRA